MGWRKKLDDLWLDIKSELWLACLCVCCYNKCVMKLSRKLRWKWIYWKFTLQRDNTAVVRQMRLIVLLQKQKTFWQIVAFCIPFSCGWVELCRRFVTFVVSHWGWETQWRIIEQFKEEGVRGSNVDKFKICCWGKI